MEKVHGATVEKIGMGLVCSVETFKRGNITLVKRLSGFNGLSVYNSGEVRKIELKTMERSDYWIAINGFMAIEKLFFDRDYWIYFVLIPENIVIMVRALPFIKKQMDLEENKSFDKLLEDWIKQTKNLTKVSGMKFVPRLNIKFKFPIRKLVAYMRADDYAKDWDAAVPEIWENMGEWRCIHKIKED